MAEKHGMIDPFEPGQVREHSGGRIVSYGTSSYGYRAGDMVDDGIEEFSDALNNPPRGGSSVNQAFGKVTPV